MICAGIVLCLVLCVFVVVNLCFCFRFLLCICVYVLCFVDVVCTCVCSVCVLLPVFGNVNDVMFVCFALVLVCDVFCVFLLLLICVFV